MELPQQPRDLDFDSNFLYRAALLTWERVCTAIIQSSVPSHAPAETPQQNRKYVMRFARRVREAVIRGIDVKEDVEQTEATILDMMVDFFTPDPVAPTASSRPTLDSKMIPQLAVKIAKVMADSQRYGELTDLRLCQGAIRRIIKEQLEAALREGPHD